MIESKERKDARAELRVKFLRALCELNGEPCSITTVEGSRLNATFQGWKTEGAEVLLSDLRTPTGDIHSSAVVRTPDIISIEYDNTILLPAR